MKLQEILIGAKARTEQYKLFIEDKPVTDYKLSGNTLYLIKGEEQSVINLLELLEFVQGEERNFEDVIVAREDDYTPFLTAVYKDRQMSLTGWMGDKIILK